MKKVKNFTDLIAYQKSHALVLDVYLLTKKFPEDEKFALVNQMRRSAVSITSNIAEGFSRNSTKDKAHFYAISKGSLTEVYSQLLISKDLKYISEKDMTSIEIKITECARLVSGLIKSAINY